MNLSLRLWAVSLSALIFILIFGPVFAGVDGGTEALKIVSTETGTTHVFNVELALTPEQHMRGLMLRKSMPDDTGMLFVFADESIRYFWMKDTLMPLDMLFIGRDGIVADIHENAIPFDTTQIRSARPASFVLEINGGLSSKLGLKSGDRVLNDRYFPVKLAD